MSASPFQTHSIGGSTIGYARVQTLSAGCGHIVLPRDILFRPLGKLAGRAIFFACVNLFFSLFFLQSYLSIYWTDFHDLLTKRKVFA